MTHITAEENEGVETFSMPDSDPSKTTHVTNAMAWSI
jgi:hypothetical protein